MAGSCVLLVSRTRAITHTFHQLKRSTCPLEAITMVIRAGRRRVKKTLTVRGLRRRRRRLKEEARDISSLLLEAYDRTSLSVSCMSIHVRSMGLLQNEAAGPFAFSSPGFPSCTLFGQVGNVPHGSRPVTDRLARGHDAFFGAFVHAVTGASANYFAQAARGKPHVAPSVDPPRRFAAPLLPSNDV